MIDPILNLSLEETRELHTRWSQFHDFCLMAMKGQKVTSQAEMKFLELKSRIAMLHDSFMARLQHEQKTGQNIMNIVGDCITLGRMTNASEAERQKFEFDWNEGFLLLTEQIGSLEQEQQRLAAISERVYRAQKRKEVIQAQIHNFAVGIWPKIFLGIAVAVGLYWGLNTFRPQLHEIPGVNKFCVAIEENILRYMFKDMMFFQLDDVPKNKKWKAPDRVVEDSGIKSTMNFENFNNTFITKMQLNPQELESARALTRNHRGLETDAYLADRQPVLFYFVLFRTTDDAKRFVEICHGARQRVKNPPPDDIKNFYMTRKANLVGIGWSPHVMGKSFLWEKWKFEVDGQNLY